jgi:hypothetical protein
MAPFVTLNVNGTERKIDCALELFSAAELNAVERHTGMPWKEWFVKLADRRVSSLAWTALAWLAERRAGSFVPFDEFEDTLKVMELVGSATPEDTAEVAEKVRRKRST